MKATIVIVWFVLFIASCLFMGEYAPAGNLWNRIWFKIYILCMVVLAVAVVYFSILSVK